MGIYSKIYYGSKQITSMDCSNAMKAAFLGGKLIYASTEYSSVSKLTTVNTSTTLSSSTTDGIYYIYQIGRQNDKSTISKERAPYATWTMAQFVKTYNARSTYVQAQSAKSDSYSRTQYSPPVEKRQTWDIVAYQYRDYTITQKAIFSKNFSTDGYPYGTLYVSLTCLTQTLMTERVTSSSYSTRTQTTSCSPFNTTTSLTSSSGGAALSSTSVSTVTFLRG